MAITSLPKDIHSKGDRKPDDWLGHLFRVSGLSSQVPGSGVQVQVRVRVRVAGNRSSVIDSVICHLSSIQSSELPHTLKYRLQLLIAERAVPKEEAGDLTVEGFLAGMLDRVALLSDGELGGIR